MKKTTKPIKNKQLRKPISQNFAPKRLAISYQPPMIIMQYLVLDTGKLYHHKIRLDSILKKNNVNKQQILNYIKNKHHLYFINGKIKDLQLMKFIQRILVRKGKNQINLNNPQKIEGDLPIRDSPSKVQPGQDDFDYLNDDQQYEEDYQDYQEQPKKVQLKQKQKPKPNKNTFLTYCQEYQQEQEDAAQASWDLDMDQNADFV